MEGCELGGGKRRGTFLLGRGRERGRDCLIFVVLSTNNDVVAPKRVFVCKSRVKKIVVGYCSCLLRQ